MKKKTQKLKLGKKTISELDQPKLTQIKGGYMAMTGGCTDGCGFTATHWNCTRTQCTANCTLSCHSSTAV